MQMDSDLVIYRTTLVRTFQVVTICRVDKSEVLVVLLGIRIRPPAGQRKNENREPGGDQYEKQIYILRHS
ncbi:hypothetical protein F511_47488 [Dorcoceras hygrometricum]|uniref:Uncharacterized protein n=1 Tax=Dorcoceras hygrometricum TaxID=472368 RepID=A0A2Z6ZQX6_9LAMI|nr:hypothetical protein F511_47488 [Dorcoceras hygrometricum]